MSILASTYRTFLKPLHVRYTRAQAMRYFLAKTQDYKSLHNPLKPLPQEAKEACLDFWSHYLPASRLSHTLDWHTIIYNSNRFCPTHHAYLDNAFYYMQILPALNAKGYVEALADKNYADLLFTPFNRPKSIAKCINGAYFVQEYSSLETPKTARIDSASPRSLRAISKRELISLVRDSGECVIKPTKSNETGSGKGVALIESSAKESELEALLTSYKSDFIVQEKISQSKWLSALNPTSINTFRIVSLLWEGRVEILSATLLVGEEGLTSNGGHFRIGIDLAQGCLRDFIIRGKGEHIDSLPNATKDPRNLPIPNLQKLLDMAKDMHSLLPHFKLIGWDFTLDSSDEPMFIELNPDVPSCEIPEQTNEPLFKNHEEIFAFGAAYQP